MPVLSSNRLISLIAPDERSFTLLIAFFTVFETVFVAFLAAVLIGFFFLIVLTVFFTAERIGFFFLIVLTVFLLQNVLVFSF